MFLEVFSAPGISANSDGSADESASWLDYLKFLTVAGGAAAGLLLGPMLTLLLFSLLVSLFGWLTGGF